MRLLLASSIPSADSLLGTVGLVGSQRNPPTGVRAMTLRVVPEGLAGASANIKAMAARLAAAHADAAPLVTAVVAPAADPVSVLSAAGFSVHGGEHAAVAAQGVEELARSGLGVRDAGISYATGDVAAAASYLRVRG
jgi:hypothetical protein